MRDTQTELLDAQKARIIDLTISGIAIALIPLAGLLFLYAGETGWRIEMMLQMAAFALVWIIAIVKSLMSPIQRATVIAFVIFIAALTDIYAFGIHTIAFPMLTILPVLGTAVSGYRAGLAASGTVVVGVVAVSWLPAMLGLASPATSPDQHYSPLEWTIEVLNYVIAASLGVFVIGAMHRYMQRSNDELRSQNAALLKSQSRVTQSTKLASLGYALADQRSGNVLECNEAFAQMHGLTEEVFTSLEIPADVIGRLVHEEDREAARDVRRRLLAGEGLICEFRYTWPNGETHYLRKIFSPLNPSTPEDGLFEVISQDVTETRLLQDKLFQAQKMEAIGNLTGGVAHDFNNLLAVILGNLELLTENIKDADKADLINDATEATLRGADLTRNMLSFARRATLEPAVVDLNQLVRNLKSWIGRTLPTTIEVETSLLAGLWSVEVDASSAESGLLNLIVNARDAMPGGGKLTIETSNVRVDEDYVELRGEEIEPGRYVMLAVSDTGDGIAAEDLERIFEPFYTTKPVGAGSGLGLSMVEGFMKQSGGTIRVYSEPGIGTTFKLYFRAMAGPADPVRAPAPAAPADDGEAGRATILLVEDNRDVLKTIRMALQKDGYRVLSALSGDDALGVFEANPDIDLMLTDIVMPGELQGTTLAKALRTIRPDLPIVFMSGYASEATVHGNGLRPEDIRLMKPVRREYLLRAIEKALSLR